MEAIGSVVMGFILGLGLILTISLYRYIFKIINK